MSKVTLSPERQALAAVIAEDAASVGGLKEYQARVERAQRALQEAEDRHREAERQATEARELVTAGDDAADVAVVRRTRQLAIEAAEETEMLRAALTKREADLADMRRSAGYAMGRINDAANRVLVAEFHRVHAAALTAARHAAHLAWIARRLGDAGNPHDGERTKLTREADCLNPGIMFGGSEMAGREAAAAAAMAPWNAWHAALQTDPGAKMPELP